MWLSAWTHRAAFCLCLCWTGQWTVHNQCRGQLSCREANRQCRVSDSWHSLFEAQCFFQYIALSYLNQLYFGPVCRRVCGSWQTSRLPESVVFCGQVCGSQHTSKLTESVVLWPTLWSSIQASKVLVPRDLHAQSHVCQLANSCSFTTGVFCLQFE